MHLIDDVHTLFHLAGRIDGIVPQVPDIVDTIVGGRIDLQHIHAGSRIDGPAGLADIAGVAIVGIQTVDRLTEDLGTAGLTRTPRAREQICMAHMPTEQLGLECLRNRPLPHNVIKCLRTIFTI